MSYSCKTVLCFSSSAVPIPVPQHCVGDSTRVTDAAHADSTSHVSVLAA